jgi:hypothetical protein
MPVQVTSIISGTGFAAGFRLVAFGFRLDTGCKLATGFRLSNAFRLAFAVAFGLRLVAFGLRLVAFGLGLYGVDLWWLVACAPRSSSLRISPVKLDEYGYRGCFWSLVEFDSYICAYVESEKYPSQIYAGWMIGFHP